MRPKRAIKVPAFLAVVIRPRPGAGGVSAGSNMVEKGGEGLGHEGFFFGGEGEGSGINWNGSQAFAIGPSL